jgi:O-antigen/teichoic acid export membrane protein
MNAMTTSPESAPRSTGRSPAGIRRWISRGGWAILDQGLFATANFILNILLARLLTQSGYGYFSIAYAVLLLSGTVHTAFLTEPMLVFGPGRYRGHFRAYLRVLVRWHWKLTGVMALSSVAAGAAFLLAGFEPGLAWSLIAMGIATAPVLLQWLFRRSCYVVLRPRFAVEAGVVYLVAVVAGLLAVHHVGVLGPVAAFVLLAVASLLSSAWIHRQISESPTDPRGTGPSTGEMSSAHLDYGRWAAGTAVLSWVPGNIYYLLLPVVSSVNDVAGLRALMNLIMPVLHLIAAVGLLLLPALVGQARSGERLGGIVRKMSALFTLTALLYALFLMLAGDWLLAFLYDGKYDSYGDLVAPLALLPVAAGFIAVFGGALRACERPDLVFRVYGVTLLLTLTAGFGLVLLLGIRGSVGGLLLSSGTTALLLGFQLVKAQSEGGPESPVRRPGMLA